MNRTLTLPLSKHLLSQENKIPTGTYPGVEWNCILPSEAGFDSGKLDSAKRWLDHRVGNGKYRVAIIRGGRLVSEWNHGFRLQKRFPFLSLAKFVISKNFTMTGKHSASDSNQNAGRDKQLSVASVAKSIFSCILGIAIEDGKIQSADDKVIDYYPEAFDVQEGEGPKPGRYAFKKDRGIIFRQLISNTSGYMKPGEEPGKVFHYQTFAMNILTHAIAKTYGTYNISDPEGSPGLKLLIDEKIRIPIDGDWEHEYMNFNLHPKACVNIFGYYDGVKASALDMARLGWLWCNWGRWKDKQLIPEEWMREAIKTAPDIITNCSREQWKYGYGFWTNDHHQLWPSLPRDSFAASGAGSQHIWVCPSLKLVVVQSPGLWQDQTENNTGLLRQVVNAFA
jgi:CubicO group peptidase (beta-lactamase class C family)